jgi:hypothetical protein
MKISSKPGKYVPIFFLCKILKKERKKEKASLRYMGDRI